MRALFIASAIVIGTSTGLLAADFVRPVGIRVATRGPSLHIGVESAPAAGMVGDFNANVLDLPPVEIRSTPRPPKPKPTLVPCDPTPQNRVGGWFRSVCR